MDHILRLNVVLTKVRFNDLICGLMKKSAMKKLLHNNIEFVNPDGVPATEIFPPTPHLKAHHHPLHEPKYVVPVAIPKLHANSSMQPQDAEVLGNTLTTDGSTVHLHVVTNAEAEQAYQLHVTMQKGQCSQHNTTHTNTTQHNTTHVLIILTNHAPPLGSVTSSAAHRQGLSVASDFALTHEEMLAEEKHSSHLAKMNRPIEKLPPLAAMKQKMEENPLIGDKQASATLVSIDVG